MDSAGVHRPAGYEAHHIAASGDERASTARGLLSEFNIDINDAENGVFLSSRFHRRMHTNEYYDQVETMLAAADSREQAIEVLDRLRRMLLEEDMPK